jgi:hypothetical protein
MPPDKPRRPPGAAGRGGLLPPSGDALLRSLLDDPAAPAIVARVPSVALHRLLSEIGLADSAEVLEMATPEQVREVLDLQLWQPGGELDAEAALDWLSLLASLEPEVASRHLRALDIELLSLTLLRHIRVHLAADETAPEESEGTLMMTPDRWFVLELMAANQVQLEQLTGLLDTLYRDDPDDARRLLQNLIYEIPSELEEWCLRWRNGRLQDLGFADPAEALVLYAYLDPASVRADEGSADQPLRADPEPASDALLAAPAAPAGSFLDRALTAVEDPAELDRLAAALAALGNRNLAADQVPLSDLEAARGCLQDLHFRLSLGLEHLCDGDPERAPAVLSGVALLRVARLGFSLTLDLRRRLRPLARGGELGRKPWTADLLDPPLDQRVEALLRPKPRYLDPQTGAPRSFQTLAELDHARTWVERAEAATALTRSLRLPDPLPPGVTRGDLLRTGLVNQSLGREGPLDAEALADFLRQGFDDRGQLDPRLRNLAEELLSPDDRTRPALEEMLLRLQRCLAPLSPADLDLRYIDGLWLEG